MITPEGMQEIAETIAALVEEARFYKDGQEISRPPFRINVEKERIRVLIYLDDSDVGRFEYFSIMSKSGKVLFQKTDSIEKTEPEGLVVAFSLRLQEVEG